MDHPRQDPSTFFSTDQPRPKHLPPHRNWRDRHSLRLFVTNLPSGVTTRDIYHNFEKHGTLVRISISETRQGERSSEAEVDFEPVPDTDFWRGNILTFKISGRVERVRAILAKYQPERFKIQSPVNQNVTYPERIEVNGEALDFGFLSKPDSMTIMATTGPSKLKLNLRKKELEVHFSFLQISSTQKTRDFRFQIALDDEFSIWQTAKNSFVMHLPKAPWYTKMLNESKLNSHSKDGRVWSIDDLWARQTDLCTEIATYRQLERTPVGLPKVLNTINIFKWTTFRFHVRPGVDNERETSQFLVALKDWNVQVHRNQSLQFTQGSPTLETDTWTLINGNTSNDASLSSFDQDFSRIHLPFEVRYQLEVCMSHGYLSEYSITPSFLEKLAQWPQAKAKSALVYVATQGKRLYDPNAIFTELEYAKPVRPKQLPDHCIEVYSATVTATGILFNTPSIEITNRIIRKYKSQSHRFLRVRFEDDDYRGQTRLFPSDNNRMITIFNRVKRALTLGIKLGDITYEFLAWGNSQLREHGVYMVAPIGDMTADKIRAEMGSFNETVVAKKAARMGQCFSTTKAVKLGRMPMINEQSLIPDIKRGRFMFTDGVGKMSPLAASLVSNQLGIKGEPPCLFQFRLGGCKGVLAVSKDVPAIGIEIRESQFKFNSLVGELEIIRWAEFWQPYLNRQIILCLGFLGVPTKVFLRMQDETVLALNNALQDDGAAMKALRSNVDPNMMTLSICELVDAGFRTAHEPFVIALLRLWRAWSLKHLKEKAKIPVQKGAFVLGCVDETATLRGHTKNCPTGSKNRIIEDPSYLDKLPQIFIQITDVATGKLDVITGVCILARNPSLHPGDIRVVQAVDVLELRHMRDVVVMPQTGDRDLPSMCSGGDLDGDDYIVIWDPELIPEVWNVEPFHYEPPPPKTVTSAITTTHLIEFFLNYLRHDNLGKIAHAHLGAADRLDDSLKSDICLDLCALHSKAVDYPKTGVPAEMDRRLQRFEWPHFMEKKGRRQYHSNKVLGKLYDSVKTAEFNPDYSLQFDRRILTAWESSKDLCDKVQSIKIDYDNSLRRILNQHGIATEFELWSTFVLTHSKASRDYKFHEEVGNLSRVLKEEYYGALCDLAGGKDFDRLAPVAVAAYKVTHCQLEFAEEKANAAETDHDRVSTMPFISFPWVLQGTLIKIAQQSDDSSPFRTTVVVKDGEITERNIGLTIDSNGDGSIDVPDIADLNLKTSKLSRYLPDPLLTNTSITVGAEIVGDGKAEQPVSSSTDITPITESAPDTPCTDVEISTEYVASCKDSLFQENAALSAPEQHNSQSHDNSANLGFETFSQVPATTPKGHLEHSHPLQGITSEPSSSQLFPEVVNTEALHKGVSVNESEQLRPLSQEQDSAPSGRTDTQHSKLDSTARSISASPRKQLLTCWFWKHGGNCRHSQQDCARQHWDTGICPLPPMDSNRTSPSKGRRTPRITRAVLEDSDSDNATQTQTGRSQRGSPSKRGPGDAFDGDDERVPSATGNTALYKSRVSSPDQAVTTTPWLNRGSLAGTKEPLPHSITSMPMQPRRLSAKASEFYPQGVNAAKGGTVTMHDRPGKDAESMNGTSVQPPTRGRPDLDTTVSGTGTSTAVRSADDLLDLEQVPITKHTQGNINVLKDPALLVEGEVGLEIDELSD
ncbi:hypothetical protein LTR05_002997 [Lithohypha guttulata]|uniref:RNA-directed RNA polymerase n=1 Tax=Lithohypha guttulata TaxID=1690604 RepID=A0AAN7T3U1_9EURO|nr:hypothetical protein LTR05_002997 [Lithohypha guttulata]